MSKYDKQPYIQVKGYEKNNSWQGYEDIANEIKIKINEIKKEKKVLVIDFYPGVRADEIKKNLIEEFNATQVIYTDDEIFMENTFINKKIKDFMTEDRVFGYMCPYNFSDFIDNEKILKVRDKINDSKGLTIVFGVGSTLVCNPDIYVYCDLARWEIQQRYRSSEISNWKHDNFKDDTLIKYKRGFFFEWRAADKYKKERFEKFDFILDTNIKNNPRMITGEAFKAGLMEAVGRPFRVVPFFDPGVWGGQWMKEVCDLDRNMKNFAWCFDCVPEENSLLLKVGEIVVELPSIDLVLKHPKELLGEQVHARFGAEFPIRFDFLDTMGGQNLSLQVHPLTEYIQEKFGMNYTQDESYYILDAKEGAHVFLGMKTGAKKEEFFDDLTKAQQGIIDFPAERYVNKIKAKKHDHFLIPAGTAHCSGSDSMVLEISSTPYIFTFKLWDWGRVGMDGKPRPIHLEHGANVLQFDRDTEWTHKNIVNRMEQINQGDGWIEEKTGLHELQFIETRRHTFSKQVIHNTNGNVNVLNLVEGSQAIVESPNLEFDPFVINYAETFIVPASVGKYTIRPYGESEGKTISTMKAFVRF